MAQNTSAFLARYGFRADGRKTSEIRPVRARLGVEWRANGSCYYEQGRTKLLCTLLGPHEPRGKQSAIQQTLANDPCSMNRIVLRCDFIQCAFAAPSHRDRTRGDRKSIEKSTIIEQALKSVLDAGASQLTNTQLDIEIRVFEAETDCISEALNAAILSLVDAGVPLVDFACACTVGFQQTFFDVLLAERTKREAEKAKATEGTVMEEELDADEEQRELSEAVLFDLGYTESMQLQVPRCTFCVLPRTGEVVLLHTTSLLHADFLPTVIRSGVRACRTVHRELDKIVRNSLEKFGKEVSWTYV